MIRPGTVSDKFKAFLTSHPKAVKVFRGFGYLFSERILKFVVGFFVHALVARSLGPEHFGKLSYVIKTVNIFYSFSLFGVDEIVMKALMEDKKSQDDILKSVITLRLMMASLGLLCLAIFLFLGQSEFDKFTLLTLLYGINIFTQAFNIFELTFQTNLTFKPLFWARSISYLAASGMRVIGVLKGFHVSFFLSTYVIDEVILKILIQSRHGFRFLKGKLQPEFMLNLAKYSMPFFLSSFLVILDQRLTFIFLERERPLEELGNYSVAVTLVDLWLFLPTALTASFFPTIITAFTGDKEQYKVRIQYLSDVLVWLAILFAAGVYLTSDLVISILYGREYANAPAALRLYSLVTVPVFFNIARVKWMSLEGSLSDWLFYCLLSLLLNFSGHYYLVGKFGVQGAIASYLGSQILANVLISFVSPKVRQSIIIFINSFGFPVRIFKKLQ